MNTINGTLLRDAILSGACNVERHKAEINDLNVFPVPDGDTGTNMAMTLLGGAAPLRSAQGTCGEVAELAASIFLKNARGNSGVITSLLFRGFAKELAGVDEADAAKLAAAFDAGVKSAYKAVMKPTEGTILTVSRMAAEQALEAAQRGADIEGVLTALLEAARETLVKTPDMLPVLKKAGVVDSGGQGYVRLLEGMASLLIDGVPVEAGESSEQANPAPAGTGEAPRIDLAALNPEDIKFAYCTEFFINKTHSKRLRNPEALRAYLDKLGDSLVFVDDTNVIKVHVHSNAPGRVLQEALKYGYLSGVKIENMIEQYGDFVAQMTPETRTIAAPEKPYGFVAVSPGDGITAVFRDFLVDQIVSGGQTMNPAIEHVLAAIDATPAQTVFVLPNNSNIILTAQMAAKMTDKQVIVLPCRTIPEGMAALTRFDETLSPEQNEQAMTEGIAAVKSGQVTYAVRDSEIDGHKVKKGEMMGLCGKKLLALEKTPEKAALKMLTAMVDEETQFVNIFTGADVTPAAASRLEEQARRKLGTHVELAVIPGGQPVYSYILSVE
ncbi:MAG TPA: DAK2 domain-containing protein [Candidatus Galloscillospira excrementipullorum]|nr:DAK2 domain-containing protein [Candidatus Galloscillospira excrementipullorum]